MTDGEGTYWQLASGNDILDEEEDPIARPTYEDVMAQVPEEGTWTVFSGEQIQFMERYSGAEFAFGVDNLTGSESIEAAGTLLDYMWSTLNEIAVRIAMQGPLAPYFDGIEYNPETDLYEATTDRALAPMMEAIFDAAPGTSQGDVDHLAAWKPVLDVFFQHFYRGEDYLAVSYGFLFQSLVTAYENVGLTASLTEAAAAFDIPTELVRTGSGTLTGGEDADIFYLGEGNQTAQGGEGPDTYVVGANFGQDVIYDFEDFGEVTNPDKLRFAHLAPEDVAVYRDGLDLFITVTGTSDELQIVNQFAGQRYAPGVGAIDPDYGIHEIVFADGTVWDRLDIAKAVAAAATGDGVGTAGNDTLDGTATIDFLDGGAGNDVLSGAGDGDFYSFGIGSGQDTINDEIGYIYVDSPDIVSFKPGLTRDDVTFSRSGNSNDLAISINGTSDTLTILDQFTATYTGPYGTQWLNRIEGFSFDNGDMILWNELFVMMAEAGKTTGNDTIYGFSWEDELDGGAGDDFLSGGNENDRGRFKTV